jgi:hypothetical protein
MRNTGRSARRSCRKNGSPRAENRIRPRPIFTGRRIGPPCPLPAPTNSIHRLRASCGSSVRLIGPFLQAPIKTGHFMRCKCGHFICSQQHCKLQWRIRTGCCIIKLRAFFHFIKVVSASYPVLCYRCALPKPEWEVCASAIPVQRYRPLNGSFFARSVLCIL